MNNTSMIIRPKITLLLVVTILLSSCAEIAYRSKLKNIGNNGIYEKLYLEIGGIKQHLIIIGKDLSNPILLNLHGGPGVAVGNALFRKYNKELEDFYTVVYWDQRGAGNSVIEDCDDSTLTLNNLIEDAHKVTEYLKTRFHKQKIYVLGQSWGTFLGINLISRYPHDYIAYIGTGQMANQLESERISYNYVLDCAKRENDKKVKKRLGDRSITIEEFNENKDFYHWLIKERKYVLKYGGTTYNSKRMNKFLLDIFFGNSYNVLEKIRLIKGEEESVIRLTPEIIRMDLNKTANKLEVPVYFFQGIHDYQTSYLVAKNYFDNLIAPNKMFVTFDKSSHLAAFEENKKFNDLMINKVLRLKFE